MDQRTARVANLALSTSSACSDLELQEDRRIKKHKGTHPAAPSTEWCQSSLLASGPSHQTLTLELVAEWTNSRPSSTHLATSPRLYQRTLLVLMGKTVSTPFFARLRMALASGIGEELAWVGWAWVATVSTIGMTTSAISGRPIGDVKGLGVLPVRALQQNPDRRPRHRPPQALSSAEFLAETLLLHTQGPQALSPTAFATSPPTRVVTALCTAQQPARWPVTRKRPDPSIRLDQATTSSRNRTIPITIVATAAQTLHQTFTIPASRLVTRGATAWWSPTISLPFHALLPAMLRMGTRMRTARIAVATVVAGSFTCLVARTRRTTPFSRHRACSRRTRPTKI